MRVLLLAVMLVLLPLRGWVGNAMAVTMAANPVAAPAHMQGADAHDAHAHEVHAPDGVHAGQGGHHGVSALPDAARETPHPAHGDAEGTACPASALCQMCHTVVLAVPAPVFPALLVGTASPSARLPADLSTTPRPGFKPPIA